MTTTEPNFITLKIKLTQTTISVITIDNQNKEQFIELIPNIKEYPIDIQFNKNEIIVCQQQSDVLEELFTHPEQFNKHQIEFQHKTYEILTETLLVLIISKFKKIIDKTSIINNFILETPEGTHSETIHRIKSSLLNINIPNEFTPITENYMIRPRESFYVEEEYIKYKFKKNK